MRSKRSGKFRKGQGVKGTSIVDDDASSGGKGKGKGKEQGARQLTTELQSKRREIREGLMGVLGENEWRVMGVDVVGSVAVQVCVFRPPASSLSKDCDFESARVVFLAISLTASFCSTEKSKTPPP